MSNTYQLVVDALYKGGAAFQKAQADMDRLNKNATTGPQQAKAAFAGLNANVLAAGIAIGGAAIAAKKLYGTLREGAVLQTTALRFDKLSASIGTTSDAMLGKLREATRGMINDMELMSSASGIISLRLADNEDQVIRLATVVGTLDWDMQQVILTFANLSKMRLDALGLSVEEVTTKQKELEAQGMSTAAAFKEAVILAGEARLDVGGVSESEQAFKQFEAAIINVKNELMEAGIELANVIGLVEGMGNLAGTMNLRGQIIELKEAGKITGEQFNELFAVLRYGGPEAAQTMLNSMLEANRGMEGGWFHMGDVVRMVNADIRNELDFTRAGIIATGMELRNLLGMAGQLDWMGGALAGGLPSPLMPAGQKMASLFPPGFAAQSDMALASWGEVVTGVNEAEKAAYGYGAGLSAAELEAQRLAETHARMLSAFDSEASAKLEDGLIGADGLVNIENANKALYEQARAAGATAGELALLGVATGALTEEQAAAALKAAILMERIKQLAAGVVSGDMSIGDALGGLGSFSEQLNSGAMGGIEGLASAAEEFANGDYQATLNVENAQALTGLEQVQDGIDAITGQHNAHINVTYNIPDEPPRRAIGGPVSRNQPYIVGEAGPELFVPSGSGTIAPNSQLERLLTSFQGGSTYNVTVTNYIDGKAQPHGSLEDITADKMAAALRSLGLGGR